MSVDSHLAELERRHEALKREIHEAQSHPGFDEFVVERVQLAQIERVPQLADQIAELRVQVARLQAAVQQTVSIA